MFVYGLGQFLVLTASLRFIERNKPYVKLVNLIDYLIRLENTALHICSLRPGSGLPVFIYLGAV